jgi:hypothetical protein
MPKGKIQFPCSFCNREFCTLSAKECPANKDIKMFLKQVKEAKKELAYEAYLTTVGLAQ